jgi:hypothetical protein
MKNNDQTPRLSRNEFLQKLAFTLPLVPGAALLAQTDEQPPIKKETKPDLGTLRAYVELARSDIRTQKAWVIAQNLPLTETESENFWPLHREYELALGKILDERYAAIIQMAQQYGSMSDAEATSLAEKSFELEGKRTALKRKYFADFSKVVPPLKAARFFQIENQLNMVCDLQVAASLPLLK